ncbi:MAG: alpha-xylosidase [Prevotellaceae bacterium]|jgi:alpha-D-xyloside xylohydrolase|nr:alpha-xylosidase [Prevotellaceae bacterium]
MKPTNYHLFDFLDFDMELRQSEWLWRACKPTGVEEISGDVALTVPFQRQKQSGEMSADAGAARKEYKVIIRQYGEKILRIFVGFGDEAQPPSSEMLVIDPTLEHVPLHVEATKDEIKILDNRSIVKSTINLTSPETAWWSDLLPPPDETLDATFYPDGKRKIQLSAYDQFSPPRHDGLALAYVEKDGKNSRATMSFHAAPDEVFVGTGERFAKMDLSGRTFQLKNQDGQGVNNRRTYKNIPLYLSSRMYGMFMHTCACAKLSLADHSTRSVQLLNEQPQLDVFLIGGDSIEEILRGYRRLTGFPAMPPLWSFGVWMSRMTYFSADEVSQICRRLRSEDFPCDVIHLDTGWFKTDWLCEWKFNEERFPDPQKFIGDLRKDGFRISLWQLPYIASNAEQLDEAAKNRYIAPLTKKRDTDGSNFSALDYAGTIDFTYPKAVEWYKGLLKNLLDMGVACIKTDFGENIHIDAEYYGMQPELLSNLYALLYQKAAYEITKEVTGEGVIWARAGWAGCQRYPLHWGGDAACSWDGMAGSLKGGLHLGLSGFGFWSHDVPGFHGVPNFMNSVIPDDLYVRWTQFGVFSSHLRYHGTSKREPYEFPNVKDTVRRWWKLRYSLIPYIYEQSLKVTQSGYPLLRALAFAHPDDKICWHIDDQYYFGDDMMVAPVMNSAGRRDIYLPQGRWVGFFDAKIYEGNRWLKDELVPLEQMPVFVKYGAAIPMYFGRASSTNDVDLSKAKKVTFDNTYRRDALNREL